MDDIFFYILVIIIIIIIIIVLYNYCKNIEKYDDIEILNCHVFSKENNGTNVPFFYFPMECYNVRNNKYINEVVLHNNKGMTGESANTQFSVSNVIYPKECGNCDPIEQEEKNKIESIDNGQKELAINPSIKTDYAIKTNKVTFDKAYESAIMIIDGNNISTLKDLTNSYKKCEPNEYNNKIENIVNQSSIGECITCPVCDENQYSTCGGESSRIGECIDCAECPNGQYLNNCGDKNQGTCTENICNCDNGIPSQGTDCPENGTNHCISCESGYQLNNPTCSPCDTLKPDNSTYVPNTCEWNCNEDYTKIPSDDSYKCIIQCGEGYKRNAQYNTCEPCGIDHYKPGPKNLDETCTPCDQRGTTGDNRTASSEDSCRAKYGYRKDTQNFTLLNGYRVDTTTLGTILGCEYNYQRQNETSECEACPTLSNGKYIENEYPNNCTNISCEPRYEPDHTGKQCVLKECGGYLDIYGECQPESIYGDGIRVDETNHSKLVLKENYRWNGTTSSECTLGERRNGEITITDNNFSNSIGCNDCQSLNDNEMYIDGYDDSNNCNTECESDTYYDETACPENSTYTGGNCVCNEGYRINESGYGCEYTLNYNEQCYLNGNQPSCEKCPDGLYYMFSPPGNLKCQPKILNPYDRCSTGNGGFYPLCSKCGEEGYFRNANISRCRG